MARSKIFVVMVPVLWLPTAPCSAEPVTLAGQASIIDGDTIEIHGTRIRLWGIDAPEHDQLCRGDTSEPYRCGNHAANELATFIVGKTVHCEPVDVDRYGRTVARCSAGVDLREWLVNRGLALDWPRYSRGRYAAS